MKLVYLANAVIPSRTANSVHIMRMCQAFAGQGHDVTLIIPEAANEIEQGVADIYDFYSVKKTFKVIHEKTSVSYAATALALARRAAQQSPDMIYGRHMLANFFAAFMGCKTALEIHEPSDRSLMIRFVSLVLSLLPTVRGFVTISERLRARTAQLLPFLRKRILVAHDGADPVDLPAPVGLQPEGGFHAGYVGQLYPGKGMEIIARVAPLCPWVTFHVVGGYPDDIAAWKKETSAQSNIVFHGFKKQSELPALMAAFDVVLAPYQAEVYGYKGAHSIAGWMSPLKLFEYMAAGKAILCSDLPVLREVLTHDVTALLCPPDAADQWAQALKRLRDNPELSKKLGDQAKAVFLNDYTWDKRANKILTWLDGNEVEA